MFDEYGNVVPKWYLPPYFKKIKAKGRTVHGSFKKFASRAKYPHRKGKKC
jgi:hypothetical protein